MFTTNLRDDYSTSDDEDQTEEKQRVAEIDHADIETLKADFTDIMGAVVTMYGDNQ